MLIKKSSFLSGRVKKKKIKVPVRESRFWTNQILLYYLFIYYSIIYLFITLYYIMLFYGDIQEIKSFSSNFVCKLDIRMKRCR